MGSSRREESNRSCCTWPRILLLVILLAVAGVCVWKFVPWEDSINNVLGAVPIPENNSNGDDTNSNIANQIRSKQLHQHHHQCMNSFNVMIHQEQGTAVTA